MEKYESFVFLLGVVIFMMAIGVPVAIMKMTTNIIG